MIKIVYNDHTLVLRMNMSIEYAYELRAYSITNSSSEICTQQKKRVIWVTLGQKSKSQEIPTQTRRRSLKTDPKIIKALSQKSGNFTQKSQKS
jgi:hypothetical protein